jgi:hypothetical protein
MQIVPKLTTSSATFSRCLARSSFLATPGDRLPKNSGIVAIRNANLFSLQAVETSLKITPLRAQVFQPGSSNSFEILRVAESFWKLYSTIFSEAVENAREENCSLFDTFSSQFLQMMLEREFLSKTAITKLSRIKSFAFGTRLSATKWPSVRFAIQLTNKNSKLVAISR